MTVDNLHCMCVSTNPKDRWFRLATKAAPMAVFGNGPPYPYVIWVPYRPRVELKKQLAGVPARYHWVWVRRDMDARLSHHVLYLRRG